MSKMSFGIRTWIKNTVSKPNKEALFVFGFQKSGTSAIAGLLAKSTGKSVTIDIPYLWHPYNKQIINGDLKIKNHIKKFSYPFSKDIIKEPNTTFFIPQLKEYFNLKNYIFIIRNPFDNIRSILNRLGLPGNFEKIDVESVPKNWQEIFSETGGYDYISVLAKHWVAANNQPDIVFSKSCAIVRYEDFNMNKEEYIEQLAIKLGLKPINTITHLVDRQFQPKGNSNVNLKDFYGEKNYNKIENICNKLIKEFY